MLLLAGIIQISGGLSMTQARNVTPVSTDSVPAIVIDVTELEPGLLEKVRVANSNVEIVYEYDKREVCKVIRVI